MQSDRKSRSVLGSASEWCDSEPLKPRFKDPEKLLRAALGDSFPERNIKRLLRKLVTDIASRDEEFRVELKKDLGEIAKGRSHRPKTYPDWFVMMIFFEVKSWKEAALVKTLNDAFAKSADLHRSEYPDLTEDAIRGIYQRELARLRKHKTP